MFCCILCTEKLFYAKMITKLLFPPLFRPMEHQADGGSVKEITKLEKTSLSDFTLCGAELLPKLLKQLEESPQRFLQTCTDSLIVCADCVGMSGSIKFHTGKTRKTAFFISI